MTSAPGEPGTGLVPGAAEPSPERTAAATGRYGLLLLLLIGSYLFSAFTTGPLTTVARIVVFVGTVLLALRSALIARWLARLITGIVLAGSAVAVGLAISRPDQPAVGVAQLWTGLILLITVVAIVHRILDSPTVTAQSIYGAVSAYMIIGLMFAAFYGAMNLLGGTPFFANGQPGNTKTFQYFSFTTLSTLGYGDFTAASSAGRAVAVLEALLGQVFLATLVARLVATFQRPSRRK